MNGPLTVTGLPAVINPGESATGTATIQIAPDEASNVVATADVSWIIGSTSVSLASNLGADSCTPTCCTRGHRSVGRLRRS